MAFPSLGSHPSFEFHTVLIKVMSTLLFQEKKVHLVAVGIGKEIGENEVISIAGNKENVHLVTSIKGLPDLFSKMLNETCSK